MSNSSADSKDPSQVAMSLLSLSLAAEEATPIPVPTPKTPGMGGGSTGLGSTIGANIKHHRRLSSGRLRRLSDAREAASRPTVTASLHAPLAALSLSSSASPPSSAAPIAISRSVPAPAMVQVKPIIIDSKTKKRGMDYKCESCSKVYRHPSCLIKHRWEHTPHWREASKFVLSKHQQVQLLEAAAILSHLSPDSATGTSLPEDRSMWPSFLSGGSLPSAASVPNPTDAAGPRLHDYTVPVSASSGGITQLRPGLIGVSTSTSSWSSRSRSNELEEAEEDDEDDFKHDEGRIWKQEDDDDDDAFSVDVKLKKDDERWDGSMAMDMDMD